ncbi:membrane protein insertion efficiency factor YidD [Helcococcus ovis]|uniref:membrane protein insertion efficiency factor YidD n=1 Tax=Helcococcus ovis TaxID=72026 RepID=UPI0038BD57F0
MNKIMMFLIKFYRKYISPILGSNKCKYTPTCSQYAIDAYKKYNFFKATAMTIWRILRCNPFSKGGYDPVK